MKPRVFKIDPANIDPELMRRAAEVIQTRGLVAFPTETVYGLGANALDAKAVAGIFEAKDRPLDDPLIVHIAGLTDLKKLARDIPPEAEKLVGRFWPGPLTLVLKKTDIVPDIVTTGLDTVAVRMPSGAVARSLITLSGVPLAAPSANMFGRPSPTSAQHVIDDLDGRVDIVLDGGCTEIGIESTVVEFGSGKVTVLRPGGVTVEELRDLLGKINVITGSKSSEKTPGKYLRHYSPAAEVIVVENGRDQAERVISAARKAGSGGKRVGILSRLEHAGSFREFNVKVIGKGDDGKTCASGLFHLLRGFDAECIDIIIAEAIEEDGLGLAVMNRLRKAAGPSAA